MGTGFRGQLYVKTAACKEEHTRFRLTFKSSDDAKRWEM